MKENTRYNCIRICITLRCICMCLDKYILIIDNRTELILNIVKYLHHDYASNINTVLLTV